MQESPACCRLRKWPTRCHLTGRGSQVMSLEPFRAALGRVAGFWRELASSGHAIASIDVGGGLGVCYRLGSDHPVDVHDYVAVIREALEVLDRGQA